MKAKRIKLLIAVMTMLCQTAYCVVTMESNVDVLLYRSALIVGSNTGSKDREQLRYAVKDANSFADVLRNLGGLTKTSCIIVENPTEAELRNAIKELQKTIEKTISSQVRKEVLFYYSGHADERGFLLGEEVFEYSTLKEHLNSINADVRIAVVDACESGNLTREKGGIQRTPFLFDASSKMEGHAYLTSSAYDEAAMESDRIKGSYFTHTLVSGLRGGADFNSDGKVTLNEAYQFTFNETLKKTEKTVTGPQHAGYDIRLKGSGDLVMTDLRAGNSGITISKGITGNVYIRNASGTLVVEVNKQFLKPMAIGLEAGEYEITIENKEGVFESKLILSENVLSVLNEDKIKKVNRIPSRSRGEGKSEDEQENYANVPLVFSLYHPLSTASVFSKVDARSMIGVLAAESDKVNGFAVSSILNLVQENAKGLLISGIGNMIKGPANGAFYTGIFNCGGDGAGTQISGIANIARVYYGMQISGTNNISGNLKGAQISGISNISKDLSGIQIGGISNVSKSSCGVQIGGCSNLATKIKGFQLSGISNIANQIKGVELAGVGNILQDTLKGLQISGVFNYSKRGCGVQIGTVNIAGKINGLQFGVINIAEENEGILIGLLSIVGKHSPRAQIWVDETGFINAALKTGNTKSCSYIGVGAKRENRVEIISPSYGFGLRLPLRKSFVGIDLMQKVFLKNGDGWDMESAWNTVLRFTGGYKIKEHFTLWGGPTINLLYNYQEEEMEFPSWRYEDEHYLIWPGFVIGVEF